MGPRRWRVSISQFVPPLPENATEMEMVQRSSFWCFRLLRFRGYCCIGSCSRVSLASQRFQWNKWTFHCLPSIFFLFFFFYIFLPSQIFTLTMSTNRNKWSCLVHVHLNCLTLFLILFHKTAIANRLNWWDSLVDIRSYSPRNNSVIIIDWWKLYIGKSIQLYKFV